LSLDRAPCLQGRSRIAREDPFCAKDLAEFRVVEFRASQRADDMPRRIA
jgi:hypothetical protein